MCLTHPCQPEAQLLASQLQPTLLSCQETVPRCQRMYSVKKGHSHRRNVNQRPQRHLVPGEEYARQEKQLPDVALMAIPFRVLDRFPSAF
ncbi:hypothetical protein AVEN_152038-1 [Araneus ventricosus]|uniref:Uncharacterized protein n=1 Tax=Araneus ventricosus TaxID=182803 RepID=A0A4Y2PT59_ARAVE|nr:hypothetical protein AVEN_152038-1 [Araneus ventricosus]